MRLASRGQPFIASTGQGQERFVQAELAGKKTTIEGHGLQAGALLTSRPILCFDEDLTLQATKMRIMGKPRIGTAKRLHVVKRRITCFAAPATPFAA